MTQKILGLRTCIYKVNDLAAATAWYQKAFGSAPYFNEPFYVGFNIAGYELGLIPEEDAGSNKDADSVLTYWGVEDVKTMYEHFLALGARAHEAPHNVGGEIVVASIRDPWHNVVGIIYNPAFSLEDPPVH